MQSVLAAGSWARRNLAVANEPRPKSPSMGSIHFHRPNPRRGGKIRFGYSARRSPNCPATASFEGGIVLAHTERVSLRAAPARSPPSYEGHHAAGPFTNPERHCRLSVARDDLASSRSPNVTSFRRPCVSFFFWCSAVIPANGSAEEPALSVKGIFVVWRPPISPTLFHGVWGAWIRPHRIITNTLVSRQANV